MENYTPHHLHIMYIKHLMPILLNKKKTQHNNCDDVLTTNLDSFSVMHIKFTVMQFFPLQGF
jgi:hypothetical protein